MAPSKSTFLTLGEVEEEAAQEKNPQPHKPNESSFLYNADNPDGKIFETVAEAEEALASGDWVDAPGKIVEKAEEAPEPKEKKSGRSKKKG